MGKRETKEAKNTAIAERERNIGLQTNLMAGISERTKAAQASDSGGTMNPEQMAKQRSDWAGLGVTGGFDPGEVEKLRGRFGETATTGGFDPEQLTKMRETAGKFVDTGGLEPGAAEGIRGKYGDVYGKQGDVYNKYDDVYGKQGNVYNEFGDVYNRQGGVYDKYRQFSETGGMTEEEKANMRARAAAPGAAVFSNLSEALNRRRAVQSGYGPGFDASKAAISREAADQLATGSRDTEANLLQQTREGRFKGVAGMGTTAGEMGTTLGQKGKVAAEMGTTLGQKGAMAGEMGKTTGQLSEFELALGAKRLTAQSNQQDLEKSVAAGRMKGASEQVQLESAIAKGRLEGTIGASQFEELLAKLKMGTLSDLDRQQLGLYTGGGNLAGNNLNTQAGLATQPGVGTNIIRGIGAVSGAASAFLPGSYTGGH